MLGINCLLNNVNIMPHLRQIVEYTGFSIAENGKRPTIEAVYNSLRKAGLEVDVQTVSHLYEDVFDLNDEVFSTVEEVEAARSASFRKIADKRAQLIKSNQIGKDSPVTSVATQIANMISGDLKALPSIQKLMQERLAKAAKKVMGLKGKTLQGKTTEEILREVLELENNNPYHAFGLMDNAETLFKEFQKEMQNLAGIAGDPYQEAEIQQYADIMSQASYHFLLSTPEMQKIITDVIKEAGFGKTLKNGTTVVDYNKLRAAEIDFRETARGIFEAQGFSPKDTQRIIDEIEGEYDKLVAAKTEKVLAAAQVTKSKPQAKSAIDKMLNLYHLGIFQSSQQLALFNLMGVSSANQQQVQALKNLMKQYNKAVKLPMGKWSHTYIKTLQREIENIIEGIEESDVKMKALRYWGFLQQLNGAAILMNLQNVTENTTSGLVELMITAVRNPTQAWQAVKTFWTVFKDVVGGGVREGNELGNTFNTSGNLEDRFNPETAKTTKQKWVAGFAQLQRTILSSFDNAYKASITQLLTLDTMRKVLKTQGLTNSEAALVINEMYHGNRAEIEDVAKQLESNLKAAGVKNTKGKWARMAGELSMANLLTDGTFFQDTLSRLQTEGKIDPAKNPKLNEKLIKAIMKAAGTTASKGLGHQADSIILEWMDNVGAGLNKDITEARASKDKRGLVRAEAWRNIYGMVNRFRSGSLRWMWLSFQKASGIALVQTLLTDVAWNKGYKYLNIDNLRLTSDDEAIVEEDLSKYLALRQRLARETIVPLLSYGIGYGVILPAMLAAFKGAEGDDEEKKYARLAKWIEEDNALRRWIQKGFPVVVYNYLRAQVNKNYGKVSLEKKPDEPRWSDVIDPEIATWALLANWNQTVVAQTLEDVKTQLNTNDGSYSVPFGKFVGNFLNMGGFLKGYQLNVDAVKALQGKPTRLSNAEYKAMKPGNMWDAVLYNTLNQELYKKAK